MKTDYVCSWRNRSARGSPWWRTRKLLAVPILAVMSLAATNSWANYLTNGDFQDSDLTFVGVGGTTISLNLNQWLAVNATASNPAQWTRVPNGLDGPGDFFAKHAINGGGSGQKIVQLIDATGIEGKLALSLDYVYEEATTANSNPQGRVSLVGFIGDRAYEMGGGKGVDGHNNDNIYIVVGPDALLDQVTLPYADTWQHAVTLVANIPAATYDYIGVVVQASCYDGGDLGDTECDTLRGVDNFTLVIDEIGPYTKNVEGVPNASVVSNPFTVQATVTDVDTGNSTIKGAEYRILQGAIEVVSATAMGATDGSFDMPWEDVSAVYGGLPVGDYEICVRGEDVANNWGEESCSRFVVYDPADAQGVSFQLSNECAQFYTLENEGAENEITTLHYGENIVFDADFRLMLDLDINGNVNFKYSLKGNGSGYGVMSGIQYQFQLNQMARFKTDLSDFDPTTFEFKARARIVGQAQEVDGYGILNGAQNNAEVFVTVRVHYAGGHVTHTLYDWGVECAGDPWQNLMEDKDYLTREPVERGYGKETNKYGWAGLDYHGLLVGTKNAWYDILTYINGDGGGPISTCIDNPPLFGTVEYPEIYWRFACMEIYGTTAVRTSEGAELWRWDYEKNKRWMKLYDAVGTDGPDDGEEYSPPDTAPEYVQGFRDAVEWDGKACFAADRGAFISGVSYETLGYFPGVAILCSEDGINFEELTDCPAGLCGGGYPGACGGGGPVGVPTNNVSIRALASYKPGREEYLMIGTLNSCGGEIWSYDGSNFRLEKKFDPDYPIVGELEPYDNDLYIGLGGALTVDDYPDNDYLWKCHGCGLDSLPPGGDFAKVDDLPDIDENSLFVIKLFTAYGKLFAGTVNFVNGFSFLSYDANTDTFDIIADGPYSGGFFDHFNIYLWAALSDNDGASTGDINGRIFIGTFNPSTITEIPRGTAELYYSDDGGVSWTQYPMPIGWSLLGYGIRNMVACDDGKFLCLLSATNMVAPDLIDIDNPLAAGLQVWAIMNTKVASPSGPTIKKGKGKNK